jgi:phosphoglycolate phosphatase
LLIIFDLDGTLIDSSRDLAVATNAMRANFGLGPLDQSVINSYVGNGAPALVHRALGQRASEQQQADALQFFMQFYRAHSLEHTKLYPGVSEALENLLAAGHTLGVLTNKPEKISQDILAGLAVAGHFFGIYGGNTFPQKKPNPIGILTMSNETGIGLEETVMVGDSSVDVQTARNAEVRSCGVTWGFQPESFKEWPPDMLVEAPDQLTAMLTAPASESVQPS